jgi:iron complex outermembrane receptor protein
MYTGKFQSSIPFRTQGLQRTLADGRTVNDGMIPDGVFNEGVVFEDANKVKHNMTGKTYQEAVDMGLLKPLSAYQYHKNGYDWGSGIRDNGIMECSWISLRDVSLSWAVPAKWTRPAHINNLMLSFNVRNVLYLYNSLPNGIYPDALVNNYSSQFREGGGRPYSRRYGFTVSLNF